MGLGKQNTRLWGWVWIEYQAMELGMDRPPRHGAWGIETEALGLGEVEHEAMGLGDK